MLSMIAQLDLSAAATGGGGLLAAVMIPAIKCFQNQEVLRAKVSALRRRCARLERAVKTASRKPSRKQAITGCLTTLEELVSQLKAMKTGLDPERATEAIKRAQALIPEFREMLDSA